MYQLPDLAAFDPKGELRETLTGWRLCSLSDIETSVAVRSETDPRDPESAAGWTSKRAEQQTRSAQESSTCR
ncbi:hypothetical protein MES5069_370147 [Mesorhizobium escarrei]|uniref:Uncharacterized protein n=1 Tax=Mesorhizobium escarrei TaxID=666018 RepID=A0ABN8K1T8_9HYPH|nr:hypothetical protein MES5069_370147 [Mesorhizobium escarrei]